MTLLNSRSGRARRTPNAVCNAIGYAMHSSRSHDAVIRVYDAVGNVIETHEHKGDLKGALSHLCAAKRVRYYVAAGGD